jgi:hypothetical protein
MSTSVGTAIGKFVWHDLMTTDVERATAFYTELLGWETEVWKPGEFDYPMIKADDQMHGGFGAAQGGAPSHWLGHVLVEDVDAAVGRAEKAGGSVVAPAMDIPDVGRMAVLADPQGAVLSVFAAAGESPASEGVFVWDELLTTDVEGAKRFYGEVLGWSPRAMDVPGGGEYTIFATADTDRAGCMTLPEEAKAMGAPPSWMTYVGTADVDATAAKVKALGGAVYREPWDIGGVGRIAVVADPTGASFGLFQPASA